ncbi:MAG: ATP-binding protein [Bacteroides sp.]|nr:ATP-binding protein [Eubacterium sp.]MCM1417220.1 ATP-binding protein [Roseburia sp.]MCM1461159.1 ATP-binding protein [Bacteroides sp.]
MEDLTAAVALLCCKKYREDGVVRAFCDIYGDDRERALRGYASVCEALMTGGETLSGYFFRLAVDADRSLLKRAMNAPASALRSAVENDLSVLSELSRLSSEEVIAYLRKRFALSDQVRFPVYAVGETPLTPENVFAYTERFGNTVFEKYKAFCLTGGELEPVEGFDPIRLYDLKNYNTQRGKVIDNTLCFLNGKKAQNVLLYGDRGTGKSSTVKALVNEYPTLRIVQIPKKELLGIERLYAILKELPLRFILFLDDLTFSDGDESYGFLKQVLEGSVIPMPPNCLIYATTNRRHILKETVSERNGDELHAADARDENMSLADRFGLYITFVSPAKGEYLDIVRQIAEDRGIIVPREELERLAERFALKKCGRSPRTAKQFVDILEARMDLKLNYDEI